MNYPAANCGVSKNFMIIFPKVVTPLRYDLSFDTRFARYSGWSDFHKPFVPSSDLGGSRIEGLRAD